MRQMKHTAPAGGLVKRQIRVAFSVFSFLCLLIGRFRFAITSRNNNFGTTTADLQYNSWRRETTSLETWRKCGWILSHSIKLLRMYLSYLRVQLENLRKSRYIVCNNDHSTLGYHDYGMTWCTPPPVASIRKTLDKKGTKKEGKRIEQPSIMRLTWVLPGIVFVLLFCCLPLDCVFTTCHDVYSPSRLFRKTNLNLYNR